MLPLSVTQSNFVAASSKKHFRTNEGHSAFLRPLTLEQFSLGLGATYAVHLRLIGKRVVNFLIVITELFSLGVSSEALPAI